MNLTRKSVLFCPLALLLFLSAALIRADSAPVISSERIVPPETEHYNRVSLDNRIELKTPVNLFNIHSSEMPPGHYPCADSVITQAPSVTRTLNNKLPKNNGRYFPGWNSHHISSETLMGDGTHIWPLSSNEQAAPAEDDRSDGMGDNGEREALPYRPFSTPSSWQLSEQPPLTLSAYALHKRIFKDGSASTGFKSGQRGNSFQLKTDASIPRVENTELSCQMHYQKYLQKEGIDDWGIAAGITVSF